jgi:hypothetical protein
MAVWLMTMVVGISFKNLVPVPAPSSILTPISQRLLTRHFVLK